MSGAGAQGDAAERVNGDGGPRYTGDLRAPTGPARSWSDPAFAAGEETSTGDCDTNSITTVAVRQLEQRAATMERNLFIVRGLIGQQWHRQQLQISSYKPRYHCKIPRVGDGCL